MRWLVLVLVLSLVACSDDDSSKANNTDDAGNNNGGDASLDLGQDDDGGEDLGTPDLPEDQGQEAKGFEPFTFNTNAKFQVVHAVSATEAWIGTDDGMYRFKDGQILPKASFGIDARSIDSRGPDDVWASGTDGVQWALLKFDGTAWAPFENVEYTARDGVLEDVSLSSGGVVYLSDGESAYLFDPTGLFGGPTFYSIHNSNAEDAGQLLGVGGSDKAWVTGSPFFYAWNGNTSTKRHDPITGETNVIGGQLDFTLLDIDGDSTQFWLAGGTQAAGYLIKSTGLAGEQFTTDKISWVFRVAAGENVVWWVDNEGALGRFDGETWERAVVDDTVIDVSVAEGATFAISEDTLWRCFGEQCDDRFPL